MTARQMAFPGAPESACAARQWVAGEVRRPCARLIAAELWNAVARTGAETILMTVTDRDSRVRITAYGSRPVVVGAVTDISILILSAFADRFGTDTAPDGCGLWAEITR